MKNYYHSHGIAYESPPNIGWDCIPVLEFLWGRKWDEISLAYVHSLRPSSIRVTTGEVKTDSSRWRVTIYVDDADIITKISQECEIGYIKINERLL